MDLNALRLFVDIVDAGNLSAAARKLKMTRANVSYHLRAPEEELGVQLLRRTTRHVEPTPVGAGLYEHGRNILGEVAAATALISNPGKSLQGHVRLSVPTGLGHSLLSPLLVRFKQRYPDIVLDVVFDNRIHNLVSEDVEVALRIISTPPDSVVATEIGAVDWVVCASPGYADGHPAPRVLADLQAHAIVCASPVGQKLKAFGVRGDGAPRRASRWRWSPPSVRRTSPSSRRRWWRAWASASSPMRSVRSWPAARCARCCRTTASACSAAGCTC